MKLTQPRFFDAPIFPFNRLIKAANSRPKYPFCILIISQIIAHVFTHFDFFFAILFKLLFTRKSLQFSSFFFFNFFHFQSNIAGLTASCVQPLKLTAIITRPFMCSFFFFFAVVLVDIWTKTCRGIVKQNKMRRRLIFQKYFGVEPSEVSSMVYYLKTLIKESETKEGKKIEEILL